MEITEVETFVVDADWRNWFFVQVKTDEGITGVGEALSGEGLTAALEATAESHKHYLIGEDPLNRKQINRRLTRYPFAWRGGKLINAVASAFDIALWDIAGKYYDEPVWKLLGGKVHDEIPVYANGWHIGERTPENYAHHAKKAVNEQEYPALKCDPFAHYEYSLTNGQIDEVVKHDFEVEDGTIEVPDEPGLGVEFDAEAAREHPGEPKDSHSLFNAEGALKRP